MEEALASGVRAVLAEQGIEPGDLRLSRIPGGASRETWLAEGEAGRWVLRRDPRGSVSLVPMGKEFALIRAAAEAAVPVPEPLACEPEGGRFGSP
ncbi:MAG: phosphotransferase, partial [Solirubrobacterales bacterium]